MSDFWCPSEANSIHFSVSLERLEIKRYSRFQSTTINKRSVPRHLIVWLGNQVSCFHREP